MAEPKTTKIMSTCQVVPAHSPSQFSLPLTFFDRLMLGVQPLSCIFFYELSEPNITIIPKLKTSLSHALGHYLPLSGNLIWPHDSETPVIQYNDGDGVALTVAETKADFDYLSGYGFRESAELCSLLPNYPYSVTLIPAMTLQITLFPQRGFSVAYMSHHAVVDGKTMTLFMHSWAYICKKGEFSLPAELTPSLDRSFVEYQVELEKVYPKGIGRINLESKDLATLNLTHSSTLAGTFKLTRENIEALKNQAKSDARVSAFTVTSAYVVICLIKAQQASADSTFLGFAADARLLLDPPVPPTYFGNCLAPLRSSWDTKDLLAEDGFVAAVNVVCETLSYLKEGVVKVTERLFSPSSYSVPKSIVGFSIGGSPRFEHYNVDFGWGKPLKVDWISFSGGSIFSLFDDRDDKGGIEIAITLEKHETEAFASVFTKGLETPLSSPKKEKC